MELYIKVQDNTPVDHPILGDNLRHFYSDLSEDNIPEGYAKFVRKPIPTVERFKRLVGSEYVWEGNVITDNWIIEDITEEEKAEMITLLRNKQPFPSWTFDEIELIWVSPIPKPNDGNQYRWNEDNQSWNLLQRPR